RQEKRKMLGLEVVVLCLLLGALTHGQKPECNSKCQPIPSQSRHSQNECPIDLYFTIDTSETIALQEPPPGALEFTEQFVQRLNDEEIRGLVRIRWNIGGLHFSQTQEVFSRMASKSEFITGLRGINYLGKGTYIDCALKAMTEEMLRSPSYPSALRFAVVITDGHVTGNPCGGIKVAAEEARDKGIRMFVVAASENIEETGLREIANSPVTVYRREFKAVDLRQGRVPVIDTVTIDRIIKTIKHMAFVECYKVSCLETQGADGPKGHRGQKGAKGDSGDPGPKGERGRPGDPGIEGPIGQPGIKGEPGLKGEKGVAGVHGRNGTDGQKGKIGRIGAPGCKGDPGDRGPDGHPGDVGERGPPGTEGEKVSRLRPRLYSHPLFDPWSISKPSGDVQLDLALFVLQGTRGDPGDAGPRGEPGPPGPKGDLGRPGFSYPGARGPSGDRGEKGNRGPRGSRGDCGQKGEPGVKGTPGEAPGPAGEPGLRGPRGEPGREGDPGPEGDPGLTECDVMNYIRETCGCCDCEKRCGAQDIVFVIDSSESVGLTNFTLEKNFVINTINRLGSFAKDPQSETVFYEHFYPFRRQKAHVTVVVITDGRFDPRDNDKLLTYLCRVDVSAIGIGDMFAQVEENESLKSIACQKQGRVMGMRRFADLVAEEFIDKIETVLCPEPTIVCPDLPCKSEPAVASCVERPVDVVFLLDGSERMGLENHRRAKEFIENVARRLLLASGPNDDRNARLALLQYGSPTEQKVEFPLSHEINVISDSLAAVNYMDSSSALGSAIIYAVNNLVFQGNGRGARRSAEVSFVFITDGITASEQLDEGVDAMKRAGGVPTVIAMGSDTDDEVLRKITLGDTSAIFKGDSYMMLNKPAFFERFIRWIC
uniref:Collagen type VI alpha 2 chain n=1 Tax=Salarias fasciatus TaxID=181472 RepID=A0A672I524_SALFA